MVGDRKFDILGAKACGVYSVGTSYGYGTTEELKTAGPQRIIVKPSQLIEILP